MQGQQANTKSDKQSNDRGDEEMRLCQFFSKAKLMMLADGWVKSERGIKVD